MHINCKHVDVFSQFPSTSPEVVPFSTYSMDFESNNPFALEIPKLVIRKPFVLCGVLAKNNP